MSQRSQNAMRPSLPQSKDLRIVNTVREPTEGRGPAGRFALRNRIAVRSGDKATTKKLLGRGATDADAIVVARDAVRLFHGTMRDLPSDGAVVRSLASMQARHAALFAFFTAKADAAGLDTIDGIKFAELASKHGQRAERLAVTMLDIATKMPRVERETIPPWMQLVDDDEPVDDKPDDVPPVEANDETVDPDGVTTSATETEPTP
jgi:hypothetical protein